MLSDDLVGDSALAGNNQRIIEWMDKGQPGFCGDTVAVLLGLCIMIPRKHDLGSQCTHSVHFDFRCRMRHDDDRAHAEMPGGQSHTLCMVARARSDHSSRTFRWRQARNAVVRASYFETENGLLVLTLEQYRIVDSLGKAGRFIK